MSGYYKTESEIEAVVEGFESCTTSKEAFSHRGHLTLAVWYLNNSSPAQAIELMRAGLLQFLNHHGIGSAKYHETLTIFWIKTVRSALDKLDPRLSLLEMTNTVMERFADSRLVLEYYSSELLGSDEAKHGWVEPDLKAKENSIVGY